MDRLGLFGLPLGLPWGALWGPWVFFGDAWGGMGGPGGSLETNCYRKAALQNQWFYRMNAYIWSLGASLGDIEWGKFLTKTGDGEGNADRGAHNKPNTKEEETREINMQIKTTSGGFRLHKVHPRAGAGGVLTICLFSNTKIKIEFCRRTWRLNGPLGGPWRALGFLSERFGRPLGGLAGPYGISGGTLETTFCEQAVLQNHSFCNMNGYILAVKGTLGAGSSRRLSTKAGPRRLLGGKGATRPTSRRQGASP